jgi:spore photoproduct lyase
MIDTIYLERAVADHPRAEKIMARFPRADRVVCERYGELFNRRGQSFRLQKRRPALILARKIDNHVLPAVPGYGIGEGESFIFSHMLNCVYDCRYCYLRGTHLSASYLVFVNYEDFAASIREQSGRTPDRPCTFFSGFGCDSLALEAVTGFVDHFLPWFGAIDNARLELRTKSVNVQPLLQRDVSPRVVVAFSLAPEAVAGILERGAPPPSRRIDAMARLADRGWPVGVRFDPMIWGEGFAEAYRELFDDVFTRVSADRIHSVSYGGLRFPGEVFDRMVRLYPDEKLLARKLQRNGGTVCYDAKVRQELDRFCEKELLRWIPRQRLFNCECDSTC